MNLLLTAGKGVVIQEPLWGKGPIVRWWAEGGLIHNEHSATGQIQSLTIKKALQHLDALSDMQTNSIATAESGKDKYMFRDEREKLQRFIEGMLELIKMAKEQGRPDDPQALAERQRRRPTTVIVDSPVFDSFP